nr:YdeI/OmpD-associated family protein [Spirosomataceae bacterium]
RKSFRVKGRIDDFVLKMVSLLPMGDGGFIIPINNEMRKVIHKKEGKIVEVSLEEDTDEFVISPDLMACLEDEPKALAEFNKLPKSHQKYYSNWIESAKTIETKTKRILMTVNGFNMGMDYGEMMRYYRDLEK